MSRCTVCGGVVAYASPRTKHYTCDPEVMAGKRCSCAPGCTDVRVGDAGRCDPNCEVCRIMQGPPPQVNPGVVMSNDEWGRTPNTWEPMIWQRTSKRLERHRCDQPIAMLVVLAIGALVAWVVWP